MKKVMFVASNGGHLTEILKLNSLFHNYDYVLVTEETETTKDLKYHFKVKYMKYVSKINIFEYILACIINVFIALWHIIKEKPQLVLTTGANTGAIVGVIAKLLGKKVIYIETLACVNSLSSTGKIMYYVADKFYVQWEELTKKYEKAEYVGRLI